MARLSKAAARLLGTERGLTDRLPKPKVSRVVALHRGDPSFDTPEYIVQAAIRAMREGYTHYPPPLGDPHLREALAAYQSGISGVPVSPTEVVLTVGGTGGIYDAMVALLDEGDEVILVDPTFSLYYDIARSIGARPVSVPVAGGSSLDVAAIRAAVTNRTRVVLLNFPSNPTGQLLELEALDQLAELAAEYDLVVISDECYDQLVYEGQHHSILGHPALTNRTVLVNSFSKTYAMTGWRLGWVVAKGDLFQPIWLMNRSTVAHANHIAQRAGLEALTNEPEDRRWRAWMMERYRLQRETMCRLLRETPGVHFDEPRAAFYTWVRFDAPLSSRDMVKLLYERGLNVRSGTEYGSTGEGRLRFTFAPSVEEIVQGMAIFKTVCEELSAKC